MHNEIRMKNSNIGVLGINIILNEKANNINIIFLFKQEIKKIFYNLELV